MTMPQTTAISNIPGRRGEMIRALSGQIEIPHDRIMHGQIHTVHPKFCEVVIGDASHLLIVTSVRKAPAYHAVLIDSSWVRPSSSPFSRSAMEADLDDYMRVDLVREVLLDACGDGDLWHEQNGEEAEMPHGMFCADMGFSWGLEPVDEKTAFLIGDIA